MSKGAMRVHGLGVVLLLLVGGCVTQGRLRLQPSATRLPDDAHAAVAEAHGVRLVARSGSWKGHPQDLERYFTLVEVNLENHSGRPLSMRYEFFELVGEERHAAIPPPELRQRLSAQAPPSEPTGTRPSRLALQSSPSARPDMTYSPYNGTTPHARQRCLTCPPASYSRTIPTPDMLRRAFREGPLESGRTRQGFLYFTEGRQLDRQLFLEARLMDARTGESFGVLRIPFEVY